MGVGRSRAPLAGIQPNKQSMLVSSEHLDTTPTLVSTSLGTGVLSVPPSLVP